MSGDVQPRKRKDKKRKKDELGVIEPRGTAAALGDGDVFMHSQHEHGTGGHWCAKIVFFSLLAILVGLVGLIILENRGLSELEANAVQSQYSGVLEGWLEDAPEDDHHDEHTLELNHHDDEDDGDHGDDVENSEETEDDEHDESDEEDEEKTENDEEEAADDEDVSQEQDLEANDEDEDLPYRKYYHGIQAEPNNDDDDREEDYKNDREDEADDDLEDDDDQYEQKNEYDDDREDDNDQIDPENVDDNSQENENDQDDVDVKSNQSVENDENSQENNEFDEENNDNEYDTRKNEADSQDQNNEDDEEHDDGEDTSLEVERIEHEATDEEPISTELPALPEADDDDDIEDNKEEDSAEEDGGTDGEASDAEETDEEFLEDDEESAAERITAPAGKPFHEVEEETSPEKPTDTLEDEEEYERRQEELCREEAQASHMWLKLTVGAALLVATHAIVRRATASSDAPQTEESPTEETPPVDRRMTLIPEETSESVPIKKVTQEITQPLVQNVTKQIPSIVKSPPTFEESEEEVEEEEDEPIPSKGDEEKQELYSDEEDDDEVEDKVVKKAAPQIAKQPTPEPEPEEDVSDDVEIIDDEQIEEEEEDEEEISDVDDEELLTRLEAKYGRLPEPERPPRHKDGGNSVGDEWPGEPSDAYWRRQLDQAEREFNQGAWLAAADRASAKPLQSSARARHLVAKSLDAAAEMKRDNALLGRAIAAYLELLKMNERLSDKKLLEVTERTINRIQFRGNYLNAEPVYRLLIRRFPDDPSHRTNLTTMFLMGNRADLAEEALKETLKRWPDDRLALAQYGFVLKTHHNRLKEAADYLQRALEGDTGPAAEPRYYYHLGDTFLLLGRSEEAEEIHKRGAAHGHFLSPAQRSLYNVPRLKGQPWWNVEDTPYAKLARSLKESWRVILREGEAAEALYEAEREGLRERGEWSQLDLFARGQEVPGRCARAPVTCALVRAEPAAARCRRGQVKFSAMRPGTHVRAHVGPTNCRLRLHLGLANTDNTFLRVGRETRQWKVGEVLMFDDSFEHEVWHNGSGTRLVLIVDVWHPQLSPAERRALPAI